MQHYVYTRNYMTVYLWIKYVTFVATKKLNMGNILYVNTCIIL